MRREALRLLPPTQVSCAFRPWRAAAKKFALQSSNVISRSISPYSAGSDDISPTKKAAFATSSRAVGPEGSTRFSIRRCARPSETP